MTYSFSYLEPVCCSMPSSNCCFLTFISVSQEAGQVVWYSHLFQNFPQLIVIHTVKGFGIVNKAERDVFLELSCFGHPLFLLPLIFPSIRVFPSVSAVCIRWPKHWSFSFSICPSNEYSGLISFRMHWFNLCRIQGTKSLLQHHSSKASIHWHSAFSMVKLSHPYMTTGKIIALTRQPLVGKVMSLLCNMLSRLVIAFIPRSKHLFISWLQSPSSWFGSPRK